MQNVNKVFSRVNEIGYYFHVFLTTTGQRQRIINSMFPEGDRHGRLLC